MSFPLELIWGNLNIWCGGHGGGGGIEKMYMKYFTWEWALKERTRTSKGVSLLHFSPSKCFLIPASSHFFSPGGVGFEDDVSSTAEVVATLLNGLYSSQKNNLEDLEVCTLCPVGWSGQTFCRLLVCCRIAVADSKKPVPANLWRRILRGWSKTCSWDWKTKVFKEWR